MARWSCHWAVVQKAWVQLSVRLIIDLGFFSVISISVKRSCTHVHATRTYTNIHTCTHMHILADTTGGRVNVIFIKVGAKVGELL